VININRHNYEEFFLLYVDRELSAAERVAVEQFVQENPDLQHELDALQQTMLTEELIFEMPDKASLYRNEAVSINLENHTTQFLMYVDDELSTTEKEAVETFVLQHPSLQESFMQLKQTKLPIESIPFPDKAVLYRSEEREKKPVVYMRWWRIAAAAAVIGFAFMVWTLSPNNLESGSGNETVLSKNNTQLPATNNKALPNNVITDDQSLALNVTGENNKKAITLSNNAAQTLLVTNTTNVVADEKINRPDLIIDHAEIVERNTIAKTDIVVPDLTGGITASKAIRESEMIKTITAEPTEEKSEPLMQQVVYRELDTDADSENKSLLIGTVEINKDKLRGIFRKATSIFRSKRTEEERAETVGAGPSRPLK
jgi:hypothetical protein